MRVRKKNAFLAIVLFCAMLYIFFKNKLTNKVKYKDKNDLKESIMDLSRRYVHLLAESLETVNDGPVAFPDTAYNMKKALAVLLDSMNSEIKHLRLRLEILENNTNCKPQQVENVPQTEHDKEFIGMVDLIQSRQDNCLFPSFDGWPHCALKIEWMREMWKSDVCYQEWGVDGSDCSILIYLSEHERFCPPFPARVNKTIVEQENQAYEIATARDSLTGLLDLLKGEQFLWLHQRIERMESKWTTGTRTLIEKYNLSTRRKRKILFHMGLMNEKYGWDIAKNAFSGGPLGELVQWSDLMSAVYMLGHNVTITTNEKQLKTIFAPYLTGASMNCPLKSKPFDLIYTDIIGLRELKIVSKKRSHLLQCTLRIIDSFGTEPEYNHKRYSKMRKHNKQSGWGQHELNPRQFFTMFPHTPDNTFLGFVVEEHFTDNNLTKEDIALVYGKQDMFWEGKRDYVSAIHEFVSVHGTVDGSASLKHVPSFVINHGVLPGNELHKLLRKTKIFVGLGFPYEGPAPLEAIANGAVFLNPVFHEPLNYKNTPFFEGKPTSRNLTSQHPYAEMYIGIPYVHNIYMDDLSGVRNAVRDILKGDFKPYLPHEYTCGGMLERLSFYIEKQDFCTGSVIHDWPPLSSLQVRVSNTVQSCNDVCHADGLICEPSYFPHLNKKSMFSNLGIECKEFFQPLIGSGNIEIDFPAFHDNKCFLQTEMLLFSCAGRFTNFNRLCPCRDYIKGQVALCKDCLN